MSIQSPLFVFGLGGGGLVRKICLCTVVEEAAGKYNVHLPVIYLHIFREAYWNVSFELSFRKTQMWGWIIVLCLFLFGLFWSTFSSQDTLISTFFLSKVMKQTYSKYLFAVIRFDKKETNNLYNLQREFTELLAHCHFLIYPRYSSQNIFA